MQKKLYRDLDHRVISGVCSGLGEYFGVDPNLLRVLWALFGMTGTGIFLYVLAVILLPAKPGTGNPNLNSNYYGE